MAIRLVCFKDMNTSLIGNHKEDVLRLLEAEPLRDVVVTTSGRVTYSDKVNSWETVDLLCQSKLKAFRDESLYA